MKGTYLNVSSHGLVGVDGVDVAVELDGAGVEHTRDGRIESTKIVRSGSDAPARARRHTRVWSAGQR